MSAACTAAYLRARATGERLLAITDPTSRSAADAEAEHLAARALYRALAEKDTRDENDCWLAERAARRSRDLTPALVGGAT